MIKELHTYGSSGPFTRGFAERVAPFDLGEDCALHVGAHSTQSYLAVLFAVISIFAGAAALTWAPTKAYAEMDAASTAVVDVAPDQAGAASADESSAPGQEVLEAAAIAAEPSVGEVALEETPETEGGTIVGAKEDATTTADSTPASDSSATDKSEASEETPETTYTVTLDAAGGAIAAELATQKIKKGETVPLPAAELGGYKFVGWATAPGASPDQVAYHAGSTITVDQDVTLYAVWVKVATVQTMSAASASQGGMHAQSSMITQDVDLSLPQYDLVNDNSVYWTFANGLLTITILQAGETVMKTGSGLPWRGRLNPGDFYDIKIESNAAAGVKLKVASMQEWCDNFTNLQTFKGGDLLDTSAVSDFIHVALPDAAFVLLETT